MIQVKSYFSSLFVVLKNWRIFFHKNILILCKSSNEIRIFDQNFHNVLWILSYAKTCQNESFRHFSSPRKITKMRQKWNHHDNSWNLFYLDLDFENSVILKTPIWDVHVSRHFRWSFRKWDRSRTPIAIHMMCKYKGLHDSTNADNVCGIVLCSYRFQT